MHTKHLIITTLMPQCACRECCKRKKALNSFHIIKLVRTFWVLRMPTFIRCQMVQIARIGIKSFALTLSNMPHRLFPKGKSALCTSYRAASNSLFILLNYVLERSITLLAPQLLFCQCPLRGKRYNGSHNPASFDATAHVKSPVTPDPISATPLKRRDSDGMYRQITAPASASHTTSSTLLRLLPLIQWHETPLPPAPSLPLPSLVCFFHFSPSTTLSATEPPFAFLNRHLNRIKMLTLAVF